MLSLEENERLTQVGPGTPMGELLRRYWYPIATSAELADNPVKSVLILGEQLTLFRDRSGGLGLVAQRCAHRKVDLVAGIPEEGGLRCPYHGWKYDTTGQCIEQPSEPDGSTFKDRIQIKSYAAEEMAGLVWGYLGPKPVPLLPRWFIFMLENSFRQVGTTVIPCNWLQCQENSVDTVHAEYMHGTWFRYILDRMGSEDSDKWRFANMWLRRHTKLAWEPFEYGIRKYRLQEGQDEATTRSWQIGHPLVFPNVVLIGGPGYCEFQIRVPMDDTHTWHLIYQVFSPGPAVQAPQQDIVPTFEVPVQMFPDYVLGQDMLLWQLQGSVTDRTDEKLAESDRGLIIMRKQFQEQIAIVEDGGEPINVFRDPSENERIDLPFYDIPLEHYVPGVVKSLSQGQWSPHMDLIDDMLIRGAEAARSSSGADAEASVRHLEIG